jgi:hypothetical protein
MKIRKSIRLYQKKKNPQIKMQNDGKVDIKKARNCQISQII